MSGITRIPPIAICLAALWTLPPASSAQQTAADTTGASASTPLVGGPLGAHFDLVSLASAITDARGDRDIAGLQAQAIARRREQGLVTTEEAELAAIRLRTAERKVHLFERLAESALRAAQAHARQASTELDFARQRSQAGRGGPDAVIAAETRMLVAESYIEVLRYVLAEPREAEPAATGAATDATPQGQQRQLWIVVQKDGYRIGGRTGGDPPRTLDELVAELSKIDAEARTHTAVALSFQTDVPTRSVVALLDHLQELGFASWTVQAALTEKAY